MIIPHNKPSTCLVSIITFIAIHSKRECFVLCYFWWQSCHEINLEGWLLLRHACLLLHCIVHPQYYNSLVSKSCKNIISHQGLEMESKSTDCTIAWWCRCRAGGTLRTNAGALQFLWWILQQFWGCRVQSWASQRSKACGQVLEMQCKYLDASLLRHRRASGSSKELIIDPFYIKF